MRLWLTAKAVPYSGIAQKPPKILASLFSQHPSSFPITAYNHRLVHLVRPKAGETDFRTQAHNKHQHTAGLFGAIANHEDRSGGRAAKG